MREGETVVAREHVAVGALAPRREVPIPGLPAVVERDQQGGAALFAAQRRDQHAPAAAETDDKPGVVVQAGDVRGFRAAVRAPPALRPGADRERAGPHAGPEIVLRRVHAPQTAARGLHLAADGHDARQIVHAGDAGKAELVGGPEVALPIFLNGDATVAAQFQRGADAGGRALDAVPGDGVAHQCGELVIRFGHFAEIDMELPGEAFQQGGFRLFQPAPRFGQAAQGRQHVCRLLSAQPREHQQIRDGVRQLLQKRRYGCAGCGKGGVLRDMRRQQRQHVAIRKLNHPQPRRR